jgi:hypothetical protein
VFTDRATVVGARREDHDECVVWVLSRTKSGHPKFPLRETDVLRTPKLGHPVQRVHGNGDLGRSTPIGAGS